MLTNRDILKRYALAYIKKSGDKDIDKIKAFVRLCNASSQQNGLIWNEKRFDELYKEFIQNRQNTNRSQPRDHDNSADHQVNTNTQGNDRSAWDSFLDCLLLQCCINAFINVFSGRCSHTTVINGYGNNNNQDREGDRKLSALGIVAVVVCIAFHVLICF
ncbi:hypothetical protein [Wolbachia endosymbiont of Ctenocephalides felis wCfeT]|uniref:hypothetical protein n=1 Tax=Wolbachia endosymbiont of Ctenocephalides felis wCfeT TaxID=2732593 RepID=UPI0014464A1E|nr:hypothetical protein [Wolbachia endosymbiont of Ctenocephalides felis wCfeT]